MKLVRKGNIMYEVIPCKKCKTLIYFEVTANGKKMPMTFSTRKPHWSTCPGTDDMRKRDTGKKHKYDVRQMQLPIE